MSRRRLALTLALAFAACMPMAVQAQADKATINALEGYFDFVDANAGTILPEQIPAEDYKKHYVLDVRDAAQFAKEHVPGAANIEWRQGLRAARQAAQGQDHPRLLQHQFVRGPGSNGAAHGRLRERAPVVWRLQPMEGARWLGSPCAGEQEDLTSGLSFAGLSRSGS